MSSVADGCGPAGRQKNRPSRCRTHPTGSRGALRHRQTDEFPEQCQSSPWRVLELGLNPADLRQRIRQSTEQLYAQGLIEETRGLKQRYGADQPLLQTIGYAEALQVLDGELDRASAIETTTMRTQQFAKRQCTWFRGQHHPHWLGDTDPFNEASHQIEAGLG